MADSERWAAVKAVQSSVSRKRKKGESSEHTASEEESGSDSEPSEPECASLQHAIAAASLLQHGRCVAAMVWEQSAEVQALPLWVEMAIGRVDSAHPWHAALVALPDTPAGVLYWESEQQTKLHGTGASMAADGVKAEIKRLHAVLMRIAPALDCGSASRVTGKYTDWDSALLWSVAMFRSRRFAPEGAPVPAVPSDHRVTDLCSLLLAFGKQSNSELLVLEGTAIGDNPYNTVPVHLHLPHSGASDLLQYKEKLLAESEDLPEWIVKDGFVDAGPFYISHTAAMLEEHPFLPEELMVGGVPLSLVWAISCLMVGSADEEPDTTSETLHALTSMLNTAVEGLGPVPSDGSANVIDVYIHGQHKVLEEALDAVSKALEDNAELSEEHAEVHEIDSVFSVDECKRVIRVAEEHATLHGWSKARHIAHPTTDLAVDSTPALGFVSEVVRLCCVAYMLIACWKVRTRLLNQVTKLFGVEPLEIGDLFVAKYDIQGCGQASLGEHVDGSPWSFVVALNDDFEGGGTQFVDVEGEPIYLAYVGGAVVFCGKNRHKGCAITSGIRYILAGFLNYVSDS